MTKELFTLRSKLQIPTWVKGIRKCPRATGRSQSTEHAAVNTMGSSFNRLWLVWKLSCWKRQKKKGDFFGVGAENVEMCTYSRIWGRTGNNYCISKVRFLIFGWSSAHQEVWESSVLLPWLHESSRCDPAFRSVIPCPINTPSTLAETGLEPVTPVTIPSGSHLTFSHLSCPPSFYVQW